MQAYFSCFNLRQHSFILQQLVLKICSNYFKFAVTLFNLQQLHLICSKFFCYLQQLYFMKWYMKCFIYWSVDVKSSKLRSSQLRTQFQQLRIEAWKSQYFNGVEVLTFSGLYTQLLNCVHNCDDHSLLNFILSAATFNMQHAPCGPPYVSYTVWREMFVGSNFRKFRGLFVDLRKLNPVKK